MPLLISPVFVSTFESAPVDLPYCGSNGSEITWTDETTSMGKLIAGPPEAGSVTLALFTSARFEYCELLSD